MSIKRRRWRHQCHPHNFRSVATIRALRLLARYRPSWRVLTMVSIPCGSLLYHNRPWPLRWLRDCYQLAILPVVPTVNKLIIFPSYRKNQNRKIGEYKKNRKKKQWIIWNLFFLIKTLILGFSMFPAQRSTQRILRCEDTYGSPESPMSKMDVLTVSESTLI